MEGMTLTRQERLLVIVSFAIIGLTPLTYFWSKYYPNWPIAVSPRTTTLMLLAQIVVPLIVLLTKIALTGIGRKK